jgi:hypothetical protein
VTTTDTSAEAVERLAAWHERDAQRFAPSMPGREFRRETAATLRALLAERDRLREAVQILIANADMHPVVRAAALDIASTALKETRHD